VWTFAAVIADGANLAPPSPSVTESTIGLLATACATWLFVRALLRGNGPLGR
jgi:hypothetical protein